MSNYHTKIQEVIQWQNIRQLVHFTRIANLRSIIEYGNKIVPKDCGDNKSE